MEKLLQRFGIELGFYIYEYKPVEIEWDGEAQNVKVTVEVGKIDSNEFYEILVFLEAKAEKTLLCQTTFLDRDVKRTFLADQVGQMGHGVELSYDDEQAVWYTDDPDDSRLVMEIALKVAHCGKPVSCVKNSEDGFATQLGKNFQRFTETLKINDIAADAEGINEVLIVLADHEGLAFLQDMHKELRTPEVVKAIKDSSETIELVHKQNTAYFHALLKNFEIFEDCEFDEKEIEIGHKAILGYSCEETAKNINAVEQEVEKILVGFYEKAGVEDIDELLETLSDYSIISLEFTS